MPIPHLAANAHGLVPPPGYPILRRALFAFALLLASANDAETARDSLNKSPTALDRPDDDRACAALVKLNDDRGPDFVRKTG